MMWHITYIKKISEFGILEKFRTDRVTLLYGTGWVKGSHGVNSLYQIDFSIKSFYTRARTENLIRKKYLDLFHTWTLKTKVKTMIGKRTNLSRLAIITNTNYWNSRAFNHLNELSYLNFNYLIRSA